MSQSNGYDLEAMIARRSEGFSLEQGFYRHPAVFEADVARVIAPVWHAVDHVSRIPDPGDYFLFEIAGESIIVIRDRDHEVRAFYNVCRHRGSRICREKDGNVKLLTCPYHAWSFDLDGTLKAARLMSDDFDPARYALHPCHVSVSEGLIFLCIDTNKPADFDAVVEPLMPYLSLHGLGDAKIAHRGSYPTEANWKLVLENFYECYHCQPAHPEYCMVHPKDFILPYGGGEGSGPEESYAAYQPQLDAFNAKAEAMGHITGHYGEDENSIFFRAASRTGIREGFLSETKDGTPAAPLMGNFNDWDGGYTGVTFSPFSTLLMCNDFATLFCFVPRDELYTDVELLWFVRADAQEGKDYDVAKMTWLWDVTTIADKRIIEDNQAGVNSRHYQPGPYSRHEKGTDALVQWYLNRLQGT